MRSGLMRHSTEGVDDGGDDECFKVSMDQTRKGTDNGDG